MLNGAQMCEGHGCDEEVEEVNVEAFELTGRILCSACADDAFDDAFDRATREGEE